MRNIVTLQAPATRQAPGIAQTRDMRSRDARTKSHDPSGSTNGDGDRSLVLAEVVVDDPVVIEFLATYPASERTAAVAKALSVGVRGLTTMGLGVSAADVGEQIERVLADVTARTERRVSEILDAGSAAFAASFDPEQRTSLTARTVSEIRELHADVLVRLDPEHSGSHSARLVAHLSELLGPGGLLETRLTEALDPAEDGSALSRLAATIDARFLELRDLVVGEAGRAAEAEKGTAKGVEYEDIVESRLRSEAAALGGCILERTSQTSGGIGANARVGDFVLTFPNGARVAVEAKNGARIGLSGKGGILEELDKAMANRGAEYGICVSREDAFPQEVGAFGIYGNRILVVDDGEGTMLDVAIRWIRAAMLLAGAAANDGIDADRVHEHLARLRELGSHFSGSKRALTSIRSSVDAVRSELDALRSTLLDHVEALHREFARSTPGGQTDEPSVQVA